MARTSVGGTEREFESLTRRKRAVYDTLAALVPDLLFMNYGLSAGDADDDWICSEDRIYRYNLHLVRRVLKDVDLGGRNVLEIGSGRGGNGYYLTKYTAARRAYGVDSSVGSVRAASRVHGTRAQFIGGDAARLPFRDSAFGVVLNIEWSPTYPDLEQLVAEVSRVLEPGGVFACCIKMTRDLRRKSDAIFRKSPLTVMSEEDVTEEMFEALCHPDGVDSILRRGENDANRPLVQRILEQSEEAREMLATGYCTARITRLLKSKGDRHAAE